jgi:scyllo-inositol 2-dehydrogenase (NADP+)
MAVGLVGFGHAGRYLHTPFLRAAGLTPRYVVTSQVQAVAHDLPDAEALPSMQALLAKDDVDLVIIATPTATHGELAAAAIRAGKHVVVEKPLAATAVEARALGQLATAHGVMLSCYHNRRWDSDFLTVKRLLAEQQLGDIHSFEARWDRHRPIVRDRWRERPGPGAGLLLDLGPHLVDQCLQLFGRPDWIEADILCQRPGATVDDGFEIVMRCGSVRVALGASCVAADPSFRYRVRGSRGAFVKGGLDVQEEHVRQGLLPTAAAFGVEPLATDGVLYRAQGEPPTRIPSEKGSWLTYYQLIAEAVAGASFLPVTWQDASDVIGIIEAAMTSAATGTRAHMPR